MYSEEDLNGTPVSYAMPESQDLNLFMGIGTETIREEILASFLILEHRLRMVEKDYHRI